MSPIPSALKKMAVTIDGVHRATAETVTLPKLTRETEDYRGGAMAGTVEIDMGLQKISMEIAFKGEEVAAWDMFAAQGLSGPGVRFTGVYEDDATGVLKRVDVLVRGRVNELDPGSAKVKDTGMTTIKLTCSYFKRVENGVEIAEIDVLNGIERYRGRDVQAAKKALLGI